MLIRMVGDWQTSTRWAPFLWKRLLVESQPSPPQNTSRPFLKTSPSRYSPGRNIRLTANPSLYGRLPRSSPSGLASPRWRNPGGRLLTERTSNHSAPSVPTTLTRVPGRSRATTPDESRGAARKTVGLVTRYQPTTEARVVSVALGGGDSAEARRAEGLFVTGGSAVVTRCSSLRSSTARPPSCFSHVRMDA